MATKKKTQQTQPQPQTIKESAEKKPVEQKPKEETDSKNPYISVIEKRARGLHKRLAKIEKNEELLAQGQTLNEDQKKSITHKSEVVALIKELEDIQKVLTGVENEELQEEKKKQKKLLAEEQKQIQIQKEKTQEEIKQVLQIFYILNQFASETVRNSFTSGQVEGLVFTQDHLALLDEANNSLYPTYGAELGLAHLSKDFLKQITKLRSKANEELFSGASFKQISDLLDQIATSSYFDREKALKLKQEQKQSKKQAEDIQNNYELVNHGDVPLPSHESPDQMNGSPLPNPTPLSNENANNSYVILPTPQEEITSIENSTPQNQSQGQRPYQPRNNQRYHNGPRNPRYQGNYQDRHYSGGNQYQSNGQYYSNQYQPNQYQSNQYHGQQNDEQKPQYRRNQYYDNRDEQRGPRRGGFRSSEGRPVRNPNPPTQQQQQQQ